MRTNSTGLLVLFSLVALILIHELAQSQGSKPPAHDPKSFGRSGAGLASYDTPAATFANPAAVAFGTMNEVQIMPAVMQLDAVYEDALNGSIHSRSGFVPYANSILAFDLNSSASSRFGDFDARRDREPSYLLGANTPIPAPRTLHRQASVSVDRIPSSLRVEASGKNIQIYDIAIVAHYSKETRIIGEQTVPLNVVGASATSVSLSDPLSSRPDRLSVYYKAQPLATERPATATVSISVDGRTVDTQRVSFASQDNQEPHLPPPPAPKRTNTTTVRFAVGEFVQSGANVDYDIKSPLYPEGTHYFMDYGFVSLAPTVAFNFFDRFALGASLYLNYSRMNVETPITQRSDEVLKGKIFPSSTLNVDLLPGVDLGFLGNPNIVAVPLEKLGVPNEFGAGFVKIFGGSDHHAPGTSITHTDKGYAPAFEHVTGQSKIEQAIAMGLGGRLGFIGKITDRLRLGATFAPPSFQQNYRGKATLDFNAQLKQYQTQFGDAPVGHSDEVPLATLFPVLAPFAGNSTVEARATFNQVWEKGTVDIVVKNAPLVGNFTVKDAVVKNGSIRSQLPNKGLGADGRPDTGDEFLAHYDVEIKHEQLPMDIGVGLAYDLFDPVTVFLDYHRIFWKDAKKNFEVTLKNGDNPDINYMTGSDSVDLNIPTNWDDQNVFTVGVEVRLTPWLSARTGGMYSNNPAPANTLTPLTPVITELRGSVGLSIHFGSFNLDLAYLHGFKNSVTIEHSDITPDLDGSTISVSKDMLMLGLSFAW